ncbi:hypothetical protein SAY87_028437 [Trapa incisa]|uniref:Uncharacterized protein n=1 Tax=Trapa incisa TaxID=236973 RepID=A0AAN7QRK3_9MYRT|nr:hypothetical protein SAY87_028437 [Trapa incisa]
MTEENLERNMSILEVMYVTIMRESSVQKVSWIVFLAFWDELYIISYHMLQMFYPAISFFTADFMASTVSFNSTVHLLSNFTIVQMISSCILLLGTYIMMPLCRGPCFLLTVFEALKRHIKTKR